MNIVLPKQWGANETLEMFLGVHLPGVVVAVGEVSDDRVGGLVVGQIECP